MDKHLPNHYHQPQLLESILSKLEDAGLNLDTLTRKDLSTLDEFHLQGAKVTEDLAQKLEVTSQSYVLDVGCGIGGPCRMLADTFGCKVTGLDYTEEYIRTARELSRLVGLSETTEFVQGDALALPFEDQTFDVVWTQHAQMNIADKATFYAEIERVLNSGGVFVYYDIFQRAEDSISFPVPWAEVPQNSHLMPHEQIDTYFESNQFSRIFVEDHTQHSLNFLEQALEKARTGQAPQLGLNLIMRESTGEKLGNLFNGLKEGKLEVHAGIYRKA